MPIEMTPMASIHSEKEPRRWLWYTLLFAALLLPFLFPGHVPFFNDEPLLLLAALKANAGGTLAQFGLLGTHGTHYGPVAVWIYQAILLATHDPIAIAVIHIFLMTALLLGALIWLGRTLELWRWGLFALALSPYVWFYERLIWDNSFNIPLGVFCLAAYAHFLKFSRGWAIGLTIFISGMMLLIHPIAAPLVAAILVHLIFFRWKNLQKHWPWLLGGAIASLLVAWNYLSYLFTDNTSLNPPISYHLNNWWFALLGPRILSGAWIEYFFPSPMLKSNGLWYFAFILCRTISLLAFPLVWFGIAIGIRSLRQEPHASTVAQEMSVICLFAILGQLMLNGLTHSYGHPHYYNGTWAAFALLMWLAIDRLVKFRWGRAIAFAQIIALAALCILLLTRINQTSGTRDLHYGPTLINQLEVLRNTAKYNPASKIEVQVPLMPQTLPALLTLQPIIHAQNAPIKNLAIRYLTSDPNNGRIELVELNSNK
jgi:hypothetical protein